MYFARFCFLFSFEKILDWIVQIKCHWLCYHSKLVLLVEKQPIVLLLLLLLIICWKKKWDLEKIMKGIFLKKWKIQFLSSETKTFQNHYLLVVLLEMLQMDSTNLLSMYSKASWTKWRWWETSASTPIVRATARSQQSIWHTNIIYIKMIKIRKKEWKRNRL